MWATYTFQTRIRNELDDDLPPSTIPNERYRVLLKHTDLVSDRDSIVVQANYLSDPAILEDFFDKEYSDGIQPENYAVYTHREDNTRSTRWPEAALNDFYSDVGRLPEVSADFMRQPIGDTPLYYEGARGRFPPEAMERYIA